MKKFKGFTEQQQYTLLSKMGYKGPAKKREMDLFLQASPNAASKMSSYAKKAQDRLNPKEPLEMNQGGFVPLLRFSPEENQQIGYLQRSRNISREEAEKAYQRRWETRQKSNERNMFESALTDPTKILQTGEAGNVERTNLQTISPSQGQAQKMEDLQPSTVGKTQTADAVKPTEANLTHASLASENVDNTVSDMSAAQGEVTDQIRAAQDNNLDQQNLQAEQIEEAQQVQPVDDMEATPDQMVTGAKADSTPQAEAQVSDYQPAVQAATAELEEGALVDEEAILRGAQTVEATAATMSELDQDAIAIAAEGRLSQDALVVPEQGMVSKASTVQGQMESLMKDFNDGTPAWAAGAMRAATAAMNARGLGGSSMAGAAIVQATMEAAVPIAARDAQTFANMDMANLNNRQQAAVLNAAASKDIELANLSNRQQAALQNSTNAFALQSQNLSNTQQVVLANAQLAASLQEKTLDIKTQTALSNAAAIAERNNINLNNRQQANLQRSAENLQVNMANLSNKQQTALANAQIQASITGQELTNEQQARVLNAARISEVANINFSAEQQRAVENSKLAQSVDLANLNAANAKILSDAAAMSNLEMANLNNRQQAQVQNAKNFLEMDLANLNNEQQTLIFQNQSRVNAMLSDQAAENAANQFNAASQNQTDQFFADLAQRSEQFNAEQTNAVNMFNVNQENAAKQFNKTMESQRRQFNAGNQLIIAQANAKWRQDVALAEFAAQEEYNMITARSANNITEAQMDALWQRERDIMSYAFQGAQNAEERGLRLLLGDKQVALADRQRSDQQKAAWGGLAARVLFGSGGMF